jgi:adenine-specific DNA-methyltransferase
LEIIASAANRTQVAWAVWVDLPPLLQMERQIVGNDPQPVQANRLEKFDLYLRAVYGEAHRGTSHMPTLEFKGKPFVYSHHLSVPFRELIVDSKRSLPAKGHKPSLDDNLIIHGDNLEALKALLPRYAGKVDVIYIDPPYNTGNEGWAYNDNVNSPLMKEWLGKVVDRDDLERHDKWCCMMWPRLSLLRELLSNDGLIFVSMDENEISNLYPLMDEIFSQENRFENLVWKKRYGGGPKEKFFVNVHEYIVVYAKDKSRFTRIDRPLTPSKIERYYKLSDDQLPIRGAIPTATVGSRCKYG